MGITSRSTTRVTTRAGNVVVVVDAVVAVSAGTDAAGNVVAPGRVVAVDRRTVVGDLVAAVVGAAVVGGAGNEGGGGGGGGVSSWAGEAVTSVTATQQAAITAAGNRHLHLIGPASPWHRISRDTDAAAPVPPRYRWFLPRRSPKRSLCNRKRLR